MATEWILKTAIIEETATTPVMSLMYADLAYWYLQLKNITLEFVSIPKENLQRLLDEDLQEFVNGLVASLVIVSAFVSVVQLPRFRIVTSLRDFSHRFLDNLWRTSLLFFFEPLVQTHRILSWRIAMSVWLIAISFIYINMSSDLNSKFTDTKYDEIKSLKDIPREKYGNVIIIEDFVEDVFVNRMAEVDDDYRELKKRMQRVDEVTFFASFDSLIEANEYRIISEVIGKIGLKEIQYTTSEYPPRGLVSFSEPLYRTFTGFPISSNATSRTVEAINSCTLIVMEFALIAKYFNEMDYLFFGIKWSKPVETFENMTFGDIKSVLYVYILGCILATFVLIVEYLTSLLLKVKNGRSLTRN